MLLLCRQAEVSYYRLLLVPGYTAQAGDCMVCHWVGGPLLLRTASLLSLPAGLPRPAQLLQLGLAGAGPLLACPDIQHHTVSSTGRLPDLDSAAWPALAAHLGILGVATQFRQQLQLEFTCEEAGLQCDSKAQVNYHNQGQD